MLLNITFYTFCYVLLYFIIFYFFEKCKLQDKLHGDMHRSILLEQEDMFIENIKHIEDVRLTRRELDYFMKVKI